MSNRQKDLFTPEAARRIADLLREESLEADRVASRLWCQQSTTEAMVDHGELDPKSGDYLDWDEVGNLVLIRGEASPA